VRRASVRERKETAKYSQFLNTTKNKDVVVTLLLLHIDSIAYLKVFRFSALPEAEKYLGKERK
jgi:hypothetical protein